MSIPKTVPVKPQVLALCGVKASSADKLTREEIGYLMNWCDHQTEALWDGMSLQEILNVYRASAEWENFEAWTEARGNEARRAWNAVVRPKNRLRMVRGQG
jgi:hypothetical protein